MARATGWSRPSQHARRRTPGPRRRGCRRAVLKPNSSRQLADDDDQRDAVEVAVPDRARTAGRSGSRAARSPAAMTTPTMTARRPPARRPGPSRPPASGTIAAAMIGTSAESGPRTRIRDGPSSAYATSGTIVAYRPTIGRQAGRLRVAHPGRDEDRGQDDPGEQVAGQVAALGRCGPTPAWAGSIGRPSGGV